mgnify:CR=1 FL=1
MSLKSLITKELNKFLNESVTIGVEEYNYSTNFENVLDVTSLLSGKVYRNVIIKKLNQFQVSHLSLFEYIAPDGYDALEPEGVINFYLNTIPENIIEDCVTEIRKVLAENKVEITGEIKREESKSRNTEVIRIPIKIEPITDAAPEMNISNANYKVLFDYLGYDTDENYSGTIPASELVMKIPIILRKILSSDLRDTSNVVNPNGLERGKAHVYDRQIGKADLANYLDRLNTIAKWAIEHGYKNINFG